MLAIWYRFGVLALVTFGLSAGGTAVYAHEHVSGTTMIVGTDRIIGEDQEGLCLLT